MCGLREGLSFIEREVAWHRGQGSPPPGDRFRLAMNEFSALARDKFTNLEAQFTLMKSQVWHTEQPGVIGSLEGPSKKASEK